MLTDSVSQFETNDVSHIPRSLQKLISDMQKAQGKKPQKNPPLNITSVKKAKNKPATIKKNRKLTNKKLNPNDEDLSKSEESVSKTSGIQIIDQRSITDFFKTVKKNLSNCKPNKTSDDTEKQNDPDIEEIVLSDEELPTTRNRRQITEINNQNFTPRNQIHTVKFDQNPTPRNPLQIGKFNDQNSLTKFQNNEYLNLMSSGRRYNPYSNEIFDRKINQCVQSETEKFNRAQTVTVMTENWKTFNDILTTDTNFDLPDRRKKGIISDLLYKNVNSKIMESAKDEMINQTDYPSTTRNLRNTTNSNSDDSKSTSIHDFIKTTKEDQEKLNNLLYQLKSVNNNITKARQEITKFCSNGK